MGCGSSSLKGEKKEDLTEAPQPLKKVATNFATVDYDAIAGSKGRRNTEYAPHEEIAHKPSEAISPGTEKKTNPLSIDAVAHPPTTTSSHPGATELPAQTPQTPLADGHNKTEPYHDVTASPTTPTTSKVVA